MSETFMRGTFAIVPHGSRPTGWQLAVVIDRYSRAEDPGPAEDRFDVGPFLKVVKWNAGSSRWQQAPTFVPAERSIPTGIPFMELRAARSMPTRCWPPAPAVAVDALKTVKDEARRQAREDA